MGKYMRKSKRSVLEVSQSSMGVRTRARTLAMEQSKNFKDQKPQQQQAVLNFCYLELRSRKLEKVFDDSKKQRKPPTVPHSSKKTVKVSTTESEEDSIRSCTFRQSDAIATISVACAISRSSSFTSRQSPTVIVSASSDERNVSVTAAVVEECLVLRNGEVEASCGDNAFDFDGLSSRDSFSSEHFRRIREVTPCNLQQDEMRAEAPGSSSRVQSQQWRNQIPTQQNLQQRQQFLAPSEEEIDEFFAVTQFPAEEERRLSDRYNYDFNNDAPLPGRFDWTTASL